MGSNKEIVMPTLIKSSIQYDKKHDMFDVIDKTINSGHLGSSVIIPNICNIKSNNFHNGYATKFASYFPEALKNYQILSNNDKQLGYCQIFETKASKDKNHPHKVYVANMMCQTGFNSRSSTKRNINYSAMAMCLLKINHFIKNHLPKEESESCSIHTHKYLINYLGSDGKFVSYLLEDTIKKNITIYLT